MSTGTGLTYQDLRRFPDDHLRREVIGGELHVTPAPDLRHQDAVARLTASLVAYADQHGGRVYPAPTDVYFTEVDVVEPDVVFVTAEHLHRLEPAFVRGAPDLVVEVSSPTTRRVDLGRKRQLYEREGVPEYWFVDLDADRVEAYRLRGDRYARPTLVGRGQILGSAVLTGFAIDVDQLVG